MKSDTSLGSKQSLLAEDEAEFVVDATGPPAKTGSQAASKTEVLWQTEDITSMLPAIAARIAAMVAQVNEPEWVRVMNATSRIVHVTTTLPEDISMPAGPKVEFDLEEGGYHDIRALADFQIRGDAPIAVRQLQGSQSTTGIPFSLPGGDPSLIIVPPVEQWRTDYVFLTPNKYAFDFVQIVAHPDVQVFLDETDVSDFSDCTRSRSDGCVETRTNQCPPPVYVTYRCQLSFPRIDNTRKIRSQVETWNYLYRKTQ